MPVPQLRFEFVPADAERTYLGRKVLCASTPVGRVCAVIHLRHDGEDAYMIVNLGSTARIGEDRRAVPLAMLSQNAEGDLVLSFDLETVRRSPIYVEGSRCDCAQWLDRVARYYAHT